MVEIIPTNTCPPDIVELSVRSSLVAGFSKRIQLDVSDGIFTPEVSWPYLEGQWKELESLSASGLPGAASLRYEAHLMVEDPANIGELLVRAGCKGLLAHFESFADISEGEKILKSWKSAGASEVGLSVLLETPLSSLEPLIPLCDVVQLMAIGKLGYQGAPFEESIVGRIEELHGKHPHLPIEIDGGVSKNTIEKLARAGASRFGVGSAIFKAPDPARAFEDLKRIAENAVH